MPETGFNHKDGVSLRDYFEKRIDGLEDKIDMRFQLTAVALDKAEIKNDTRLDGMNEWRGTITDLTSRFVSREEIRLMFDSVKSGRKDLLAMGIALLSLAITIYKLFS